MSLRPRRWQTTLADKSVLDAIAAAARACMAEVAEDPDDPEACGHRKVDLMTPMEFADWLQREVLLDRQRPTRLDHTENRQTGQERRYGDNLSLAMG